jgi:flagellar motor component MotA
MKIIYHFLFVALVIACCFYFGISPMALIDAPSAIFIAISVIATALLVHGSKATIEAFLYLLVDRKPAGKQTANLLMFAGRISLLAGALMLGVSVMTIMANLAPGPQALGRAIGSSLLAPLYGLYLFGLVFYPFSQKAASSN